MHVPLGKATGKKVCVCVYAGVWENVDHLDQSFLI